MADEPIATVSSPFMDGLRHSVERSISVYIISAILALVSFGGWTFYRAFIKKPEPTQTQNIAKTDAVINDSRQIHQTFGCATLQGYPKK